MTGLLKDLMHDRADRLDEFRPDFDAILTEGSRLARRRRLVVAGSVGLAAALAAAVIPVGLSLVGDESDDADVTAGAAPPLTWAQGSTIHVGDDAVDVGHEIHAFVATTGGFVIADPSGAVWHWVDGAATKVGEVSTDPEAADPVLVADGARAGWVEVSQDSPYFVVLDESLGGLRQVRARTPDAQLWAIDGDHAYARDGSEQLRIDLGDGRRTTLAEHAARLEVHDVESGLMLVTFPGGDDRPQTTVTRDLSRPGTPVGVWRGDLSPSGRYVMSENSAEESDDFTLIELETGEVVNPDQKAVYGFFLGYTWTDDDSYTAFGVNGFGEAESSESTIVIDLLTCGVSTGACTVSDDHPHWDDFQLPIGEHLDS